MNWQCCIESVCIYCLQFDLRSQRLSEPSIHPIWQSLPFKGNWELHRWCLSPSLHKCHFLSRWAPSLSALFFVFSSHEPINDLMDGAITPNRHYSCVILNLQMFDLIKCIFVPFRQIEFIFYLLWIKSSLDLLLNIILFSWSWIVNYQQLFKVNFWSILTAFFDLYRTFTVLTFEKR